MSREEIASNIRYYLILELRCQNNSTQLRDLLGIRARRARRLYAGREDYTAGELQRLSIALGHPVEAFFDLERYMNENRARSIGRSLVEYLQEGHSHAENEAAIVRAIEEGVAA